MKINWFKRKSLIYVPVTFSGWIIVIGMFIYSVYSFIDIDSRSHSVSDTLMNFAFKIVFVFIAYFIIGFLTSRSYKK
jgi:hypothetical protein